METLIYMYILVETRHMGMWNKDGKEGQPRFSRIFLSW